MDERIKKLPQWARDVIDKLSRERDEARRCLQDFTDHQTPSPIWTDEIVCDSTPPSFRTNFIHGRRVTFAVGGNEIVVQIVDNALQVHAKHLGKSGFLIRPMSGNMIQIECDRDPIP